jgi:hypothetical protein
MPCGAAVVSANPGENFVKLANAKLAGSAAIALTLAACAAPPPGPTIPVAPGPGKSFDQFAADQAGCEQYASAQTAPGAAAATNQGVGTAILGTALGAGLGAAIGGGQGAAIGAASGAVLGTAAGASGANYAQMSLQQQYDMFYAQCMYAKGNQVPGFGRGPGAPPPYGPPSGYGPPPYGPPPPPGY